MIGRWRGGIALLLGEETAPSGLATVGVAASVAGVCASAAGVSAAGVSTWRQGGGLHPGHDDAGADAVGNKYGRQALTGLRSGCGP